MNFRDACKGIEEAGFVLVDVKGSHYNYVNREGDTYCIPHHRGKDMPIYIKRRVEKLIQEFKKKMKSPAYRLRYMDILQVRFL